MNHVNSYSNVVPSYINIHIYVNIQFLDSNNKIYISSVILFCRATLLMFVSSFWHGIHPGIYATLMSSPFLFLAEDGLLKGVRSRLTTDKSRDIYDFVALFFTIRFFEYFSVGFMLNYAGNIYRYYQSLNFFGHFILVGLIIIAQSLAAIKPRERTKDD